MSPIHAVGIRGARKWALGFVLAGLSLAVLVPTIVASAQTNPGNYPPSSTTTTDPCGDHPQDVCTASPVIQVKSATTLAFTGSNTAIVVTLGLAMLGSGIVMTWLSRRRSLSKL